MLKYISIWLTCAAIGLIATTVSAQEKMSTYVELNRAAELCFDLATTGKDQFSSLTEHGYRISQKRKKTSYKKGVGFHLFGAAGIDVFKYRTGCTINGRGISDTKANLVYKKLQAKLISAGYQRGGSIFKKGNLTVILKGKYLIQGGTAVLRIYRDDDT